MSQSVSSAPPPAATPPLLSVGLSDGPIAWGTLSTVAVGPQPGDEVRGLLYGRLRILTPLLLCMLVLYFFRNLKAGSDLPVARFGLLLQLVLLAAILACAVPLYGKPWLSLSGLRGLELVLFGLAATDLAWLQCGSLIEAWELQEAMPVHEATVLRLALGSASARWLVLMMAYGVVIPNTRRRCAVVLSSLMLMPLIIAAGAGLGHPGAQAPFALAVLQMAATLGAGGAAALFVCGCSAWEPQTLESEMVGQYALKQQLRVGGMGEVHLAEHILLKRRCAVELIRPGSARDAAVRRRFEREARAMAALHHPNAVTIHDYGRCPDGTIYYVMEYLPGLSLEDLVTKGGPLPPGRVVHVLGQLCDALSEAHGMGILHLDIKPGNAIVGDGDAVKLLDFGLAREMGPNGLGLNSSEAEGAGSPQYMAPEQAGAWGPLDARADLYGLGGVAYFLLTGRPPFECDSALQLVLAHACDPVTPPSRLRSDVPADLEAVVLRCLEKEPGRRFADIAALAESLRRCACAGQWDRRQAAWQPSDQPTVIQDA